MYTFLIEDNPFLDPYHTFKKNLIYTYRTKIPPKKHIVSRVEVKNQPLKGVFDDET